MTTIYRRISLLCVSLFAGLCIGSASAETALVGKQAPTFSLKNAAGQDVSLGQFSGKIVVLEWFNPGCPFVKKFYKNSDMQKFQKGSAAKGVVWLTVSSSGPGRPGYVDPAEATAVAQEHGLDPSRLLLDPQGETGKAYGARTTPHMFVIDPKGTLAYAGAIDNTPSTHAEDVSSALNYVTSAVDALLSGKVPSPSSTESYGCAVKYAS